MGNGPVEASGAATPADTLSEPPEDGAAPGSAPEPDGQGDGERGAGSFAPEWRSRDAVGYLRAWLGQRVD